MIKIYFLGFLVALLCNSYALPAVPNNNAFESNNKNNLIDNNYNNSNNNFYHNYNKNDTNSINKKRTYKTDFENYKSNIESSIVGHTIDAKTKDHILFATIMVLGTSIGGRTDATGHFSLKNLEEGEYIVKASHLGYKPEEKKVKIESGKTIELAFQLEPKALQINEVVVTGSRNEVPRREAATIVNVVSSSFFEKTASNNVSEVLNYQPGLRVEYTCSNCGVPQLRINGLEGQYSQILLDNRPIFSSLASVYGLEQLPAGMIERVEVLRGGGSALFGSSAIGGVVNIITKEPTYNTVTLSNNTDFFSGGADINTVLNGSFVTEDYTSGIYIFGMIKKRDNYDRDSDGFSEIPLLNSETIGFRANHKLSQNSKLTAEYHHIREFRRGGNLFERPPHEADICEQLEHNINGGGLKYDTEDKNNIHKLSLYTSLQNIERESYFGTNQNLNAYGNTDDFIIIAGGQYTYNASYLLFMPSQFIFGVEYSNNKLNDNMLGYNRAIEQSSICYGTFFQNEWRSEEISLLAGGRLDKHNQINNMIFSPRVNLRYTPTEETGFRISYSSGYRAPQIYNEDLHVAAVGGEVAIITVAPDLKPEYSQSISGSVDLYYDFSGIETNALLEYFYTDLKDVFILQENGHDINNNLLLERRNASGAVVKGVNIELKIGFSPKLILDGGFTFQSSKYKAPQVWSENVNIIPQKRMFRTPEEYGFLILSYLPNKYFNSSVSLNYNGSMLVQHYAGYISEDTETLTDSFVDIGVKMSYDFILTEQLKLQASVGVKNILDAFQKDIDKGDMRDAGYIYGPAMPRTCFIGAKFIL